MERPPHLLHFRISHYNEKVRWALDYKKWPHTREALTPLLHIPQLLLRTGRTQVPVLVMDGVVHRGSAHILEEIEKRRPDPPLFPGDPAQLRRAMELQAFFDDEVAPALRRLFWSIYLPRMADTVRMATDGSSSLARAVFATLFPLARFGFRRNMGLTAQSLATDHERLRSYFDKIEAEVGPSGYLVGDRFSVADLSVAAIVSALLRPPEFPYPLPEPKPPALVELQENLADHAGARWAVDIYRRHRGTSCEVGARPALTDGSV